MKYIKFKWEERWTRKKVRRKKDRCKMSGNSTCTTFVYLLFQTFFPFVFRQINKAFYKAHNLTSKCWHKYICNSHLGAWVTSTHRKSKCYFDFDSDIQPRTAPHSRAQHIRTYLYIHPSNQYNLCVFYNINAISIQLDL